MESTQLAPIPAAGQTQSTVDEVDLTPVRTYWQLVRQRFVQHRLAVIGLVLMTTLTTMAIVIPTVTGDAYQKTSLTLANHPPSLDQPLRAVRLRRHRSELLHPAHEGAPDVALRGVLGGLDPRSSWASPWAPSPATSAAASTTRSCAWWTSSSRSRPSS